MAAEARAQLQQFRRTVSAPLLAGFIAAISAIVVVEAPAGYRALAAAVAIAPWVLVAAGDVERVLVAAILIDSWFDFDVNLAYRPELAALGGVGGFSISVTTIAVAGLLLAGFFSRSSPRKWKLSRLDAAVLLFTLLIAASSLVARDRSAAFAVVLPTVQCALVYFLLVRWITSFERAVFLLKVFMAIIGVNVVIAAIQLIGGTHAPGVHADGPFQGRFSGLLASPNTFGTLVALALPPLVALLLIPGGTPERRRFSSFELDTATDGALSVRFRRVVILSIFGGLAILLLSQSRGSWLSVTIAGCIIGYVGVRERAISPSRALVAPIAVGIGLVLIPFVRARLLTSDHGSAAVRVPLMRIAGRMISDHPLFGVGANNYVTELPRYLTPDVASEWIYTVHNQFLLTWAESGLGALAALIWLLIEIARAGFGLARCPARIAAYIGVGVAAAVIGHAAHMTIEIMNGREQLTILLVLAALVRSTVLLAQADADDEANDRSR